jgi:large subunit ribosomal protein L30
MSNIRIQLFRSTAGRLQTHRRIIRSLGLRKLNQVKEIKDCPEVRGQIKKVEYMVRIVD